MAIPIRFAPVLEGDEAIDFYERWQKSLEEPVKRPSEEKINEVKAFIRKYELNKLNQRL
ncbi:MAG: hypothetical protein FWG84_01980 [Bacteroidales bacterium]|nr:hypothetical protein [Bacteroidales bacterium]